VGNKRRFKLHSGFCHLVNVGLHVLVKTPGQFHIANLTNSPNYLLAEFVLLLFY
jgi:hypothetical protein